MSDLRDWESIRQDLRSSDEEVRRLAVERAALLPTAEAIRTLVQSLGDSSWRVRKACVERLATQGELDRVAALLVNALADGDNPGRRNAAMEALVRCGEAVVPVLLEGTQGDDADVRKLLVDALAGIGHPEATPRLVEMLADPDANVRGAVADALGAIGSRGAAEPLLEAATRASEERLVRLSALRALAHMEVSVATARLAPVLEDFLLQPASFALLGRGSEPDAVEWLLKGLASGSRGSREAAMEALVRILGGSVAAERETLTRRIQDAVAASDLLLPDALDRLRRAELSTRLVLIQFLGLLARSETVLTLLEASADEALTDVAVATLESFSSVAEEAVDAGWDSLDPAGRRRACLLLARSSGERGEVRLLEALEAADPELRTGAVQALGQRGARAARDPLIRRLRLAALEQDGDDEEELEAVSDALVNLAKAEGDDLARSRETIERLAACAEAAPDRVRLAVAKTLGRVPYAVECGAVTDLLRDPSDAVRCAAVEALGERPTGSLPEPLRLALADESPGVRIAAAAALGAGVSASPETGRRALEDLARLAGDEEVLVRAAAIRSLGGRAAREPGREGSLHAETLEVLERALADASPVALAAVESLGRIGGAEPVGWVRAILTRPDPELVQAAIACLNAHAAPEELDALFPLVAHPSWVVRAEAVNALSERRVARAVPALLRRLETEQDDFVRAAILQALRRLED